MRWRILIRIEVGEEEESPEDDNSRPEYLPEDFERMGLFALTLYAVNGPAASWAERRPVRNAFTAGGTEHGVLGYHFACRLSTMKSFW